MKRVICLAAVLLASLAAAGNASATEVGGRRPLGLGFAIGSPTSLVGKYFLNRENAVDFGLAFWRYGHACTDAGPASTCNDFGYVGVVGDYLWQDTLARGTAQLDWHIGAGGRFWVGDQAYDHRVALFARMPVGLDLTFDRPNF